MSSRASRFAGSDHAGAQRALGQSEDELAILIAGIAGGSRHCLETLYASTAPRLFGACLRILADAMEAEDALQDTFLTIWHHASSFDRARGQCMTWLLMLARNRAVDRLRKRARFNASAALMPLEGADPEDQLDLLVQRDEQARMADCMKAIEDRDASLIRAAFLEGSSYSQLAARSATPLGTVKSRIRRALLKLRDCLA